MFHFLSTSGWIVARARKIFVKKYLLKSFHFSSSFNENNFAYEKLKGKKIKKDFSFRFDSSESDTFE